MLRQFGDKGRQAGFFIGSVVFMDDPFARNRIDGCYDARQERFGFGPGLATFNLFDLGFHFADIAFITLVLFFRLSDTFFFRGLSLHAFPFQGSQKVVKFIKKSIDRQKKKPEM